jgi:hypothetical protein
MFHLDKTHQLAREVVDVIRSSSDGSFPDEFQQQPRFSRDHPALDDSQHSGFDFRLDKSVDICRRVPSVPVAVQSPTASSFLPFPPGFLYYQSPGCNSGVTSSCCSSADSREVTSGSSDFGALIIVRYLLIALSMLFRLSFLLLSF